METLALVEVIIAAREVARCVGLPLCQVIGGLVLMWGRRELEARGADADDLRLCFETKDPALFPALVNYGFLRRVRAGRWTVVHAVRGIEIVAEVRT